jgi:hypothetical protein
MEKIKQFLESEKGKDFIVVLIVILVGLGSFELGRLSKEAGSSGIKVVYPIENGAAALKQPAGAVLADSKNQINSEKNFFASSRGTKYYSVDCSAGKTIKQENRVYFATGEEAQAAGYTLSSSCY